MKSGCRFCYSSNCNKKIDFVTVLIFRNSSRGYLIFTGLISPLLSCRRFSLLFLLVFKIQLTLFTQYFYISDLKIYHLLTSHSQAQNEQKSVTENNKPYVFLSRKRNHQGKPVILFSQFDCHNEIIKSIFSHINAKIENSVSKPSEDRQGNNSLWTFHDYTNQIFRISIEEENVNRGSKRTNLNVFPKNGHVKLFCISF